MHSVDVSLPRGLIIKLRNLNITVYKYSYKNLKGDIYELWTLDHFRAEIEVGWFSETVNKILDLILEPLGLVAEDFDNVNNDDIALNLIAGNEMWIDIYPLGKKDDKYYFLTGEEYEKWVAGEIEGLIAEVNVEVEFEMKEWAWA